MLLNYAYPCRNWTFRCVHSSVQPLRSVGRSNFDKGRHNLTTLIQKSTYINESCYIIYYIYIEGLGLYTYILIIYYIYIYIEGLGLYIYILIIYYIYIYIEGLGLYIYTYHILYIYTYIEGLGLYIYTYHILYIYIH